MLSNTSNTYTCRFPGCSLSYQRREHRHRHETQHTRRQLPQCSICAQTFSRRDTLRRHMQKVHVTKEIAPPTKHACTHCRTLKIRCQGEPPCSNCLRRGISCSLDHHRRTDVNVQPGDYDKRASDPQPMPSRSMSTQLRANRSAMESHYLGLYFQRFHPHWPFIHRGSFSEYETPLLVQSMVVLGLWMSREKDTQSKAMDLHKVLDSAIREQTAVWDASSSENACSACSWPIPTYQAILLHIIFAGLSHGGEVLGPDLKPSLALPTRDLLERLVASCKKLGLLSYPNMLNRYCQDDPATYVWVSVEEVKRFNLALFRACRAFTSATKQKSTGQDTADEARAASRTLQVCDLQFPWPRNTPLWNAVGKAEWHSATTEDVFRHSQHDTVEEEWISNSAGFLEVIDG
ncbi:hypothetical protein BO86DRAFT_354690 [Aspergillus japonicus CBS 114.51]|uniref:C2H2 type zinc finger domain protein n=1 Tax=Aspergillus japonicus CBS 114.51 TaxID=1448312 RepID=A0A8T8XC33_ASPJA|nr:hypothetical protein BO86DRAFT_354690 [Aspergillus japonicus CBS 114.51]RAH85803.1 hypothetical protein BO86DRAFT_354690 [Aspergillus japonicus CBS 114.51]